MGKLIWRTVIILLTITLLAGIVFVFVPRTTVRQMAVRSGLIENTYYQEGDTEWDNGGVEEYYFNQLPSSYNEAYRELYARLSAGEDSAPIYAEVSVEDFWTAYYSVLADHPELFWIGSSAQVQSNAVTGLVAGYTIESTVPENERVTTRAMLEAAADECIRQTDETWSDYGRIKSVYEYLINMVEYNAGAPDNQCIQSALLNHQSVCAGYAKAFQYICHRMGYFCTYVTGKITGGGDHAWNIVRIDGNYYQVDVTWGDPVFAGTMEDGTGITLMNYNYLCCTDDEIKTTHTPESAVSFPPCTDGSYNYYKINGMYYENWDRDVIYNALMASVQNGESAIVMKFGTQEAYDTAKYELFTNRLYYDADQYLMQVNGVSSWNNRYSMDDEFRVITIQWL
ncbi:MAG TPA: hypothetical protein DHV42_07945 [Lachnospiraceae bacterium]|nr:hypothetical protein [Lachnospiraceae bacterium]